MRRHSDPWFDDVCRSAKRKARHFERVVRRLRSNSSMDASLALNDAVLAWRESLSLYRCLLRKKRDSFWRDKVSAEAGSPGVLWRSVKTLLGVSNLTPANGPSAQELLQCFEHKVKIIRSSTCTSPPPQFPPPTHSACLDNFEPVSCSLVTTLVSRLPNKFSPCDPLPCRFLKCCIDILAPFLTKLLTCLYSLVFFLLPCGSMLPSLLS